MTDNLKAESDKFYRKMFRFIEMNTALKYSGNCSKFLSEMNQKEYEEYILQLEYLHQNGIIDLTSLER